MRTFKICANMENRVNREIPETREKSSPSAYFEYFAVQKNP